MTHPQIVKLLDIVKRGNAEEIESARDAVCSELLPELLAAYWQLSTWDDKAGLMQLFSDHLTSGGEDVMRDFLTAPTAALNDEYYTSGKIVALCQLAGTFEFYERLWYDRRLCAAVIERALTGETPTPALVDALDKPKPAAARPEPQTRRTRTPLRESTAGFLRRLRDNETAFIIVNTIFWIGLAVLLLSDPLRLAVGGSLLALALGIYMLYAGFSPKVTKGMAQPGFVRLLAASLGLGATVFAVAMLIHALSGGVESRTPLPRWTITEALTRAFASRVDGSSIIVIGFGFVLPVLLSVVVDRRWTRREQAQQQAARQTGEVFAIPPMLRSPTLFVMFASAAISLFMLIAALNGPQTGVTMAAGVGIPLLFLPLIVGGLIFLLHNTGMAVVTSDGVMLRRAGRGRFLRYDDIVALTSQARLFAPGIAIRGRERVLRIPRTLENLPRFYTLLLQRVAPSVRDAALGKTAPATLAASTTDGGPVYAFAMSRRMWALYIGGVVLFILFYLGVGLSGIWSGLARGEIPPFNTVWVRNSLIFFGMISLLFLPATIFVLHSLFTKYGPFKMERPIAWEFHRDRIRYRFPRGAWQERSAGALQSVTLNPLSVRVRGGRGIETQVTLYALVLEFTNDTPLIIDQERAVQFRQTPEQLHALLTGWYRVK
jgi:hypothetical protein